MKLHHISIVIAVVVGFAAGYVSRAISERDLLDDNPFNPIPVNPEDLPSVVFQGTAEELFRQLAPAVSQGDHYLETPEHSQRFIWLLGVFNNGRQEQNVLVEESNNGIRFRAWWLNRDDSIWCVDSEISDDEFGDLLSALRSHSAFELPNLLPDVSHGMTYWLKIQDGADRHEACGYHVDNLDFYGEENDLLFGPDFDRATDWSNVVKEILRMCKCRLRQIRVSTFDENGNVVWDAPAHKDLNTANAFDW